MLGTNPDSDADAEAEAFARTTDQEMAYQRLRGDAIRARIERMLAEVHEVEDLAEKVLPDRLVR